jgi:hypothetical protein
VGQVRYELNRRLRHMKFVPNILFKLSQNKEKAELINLIERESEGGIWRSSVSEELEGEEYIIEELDSGN